MTSPEYNIIIPSAYREYPFLKHTIAYTERFLSPRHIYIVTNKDMSRLISKKIRNNPLCTILDENDLVDSMRYGAVYMALKEHLNRAGLSTGWYYQQFIKLGFALSRWCSTDYYLTWDADTLPLRKISFFDTDGTPFLTMKSEHFEDYFRSFKRLFGDLTLNRSSYIAEHMMFRKDIVQHMLSVIMHSDVKGRSWWEKIINATDKRVTTGFSEFESYGNFCLNYYPGAYRERILETCRAGGLITGRLIRPRIINSLTFTDTMSFECYHKPPFPWSVANAVYLRYASRWQLKELRALKWIDRIKRRKDQSVTPEA